ncbi:MAG: T9SS type A sorting domain-containing protein [Flavobacteriales bacterium]|jgi:hypothetical protein|nr:T9SS type A sorting domain-containing protein [Flavobacteriales bacterium]
MRSIASNISALVLACLIGSPSNGQNVHWAKVVTGGWSEGILGIMIDQTGSVYSCGWASKDFDSPPNIDGHLLDISTVQDALLAKFDADGTYQWSITPGGERYPTTLNERETAIFVKELPDGSGIVLAGNFDSQGAFFGTGCPQPTGSSTYIAHYDPNAACMALNITPGWLQHMAMDSMGNSYAISKTDWDSQVSVMKVDPTGTLLWVRTLGSEFLPNAMLLHGDTLVMALSTNANSTLLGNAIPAQAPLGDALIVRLDTSAQVLFSSATFTSDSSVAAEDLHLQHDGSLLFAGRFRFQLHLPADTIEGDLGSETQFITRLGAGDIPEQITLVSKGEANPSWIKLAPVPDGSFYLSTTISDTVTIAGITIAPQTENDILIARIGSMGSLMGSNQGGPVWGAYTNVTVDHNGSVLITGRFIYNVNFMGVQLSGDVMDSFLIKTDAITGIQSFSNPESSGLHIYANPTNGICTIDLPTSLSPSDDLFLSVYDNTGQLVQRAPLQYTDGGIRLDVRAQAKGIYHVELGDGRQRYTGTIVFE